MLSGAHVRRRQLDRRRRAIARCRSRGHSVNQVQPRPEPPVPPGVRPSRLDPARIQLGGRVLGPDQEAIDGPLAALLDRPAVRQLEGSLALALAQAAQQLAQESLAPAFGPDRRGGGRAEAVAGDDLGASDVADALPVLEVALAPRRQPGDQPGLVGFRFAQDLAVQGHFTPVDDAHLRRLTNENRPRSRSLDPRIRPKDPPPRRGVELIVLPGRPANNSIRARSASEWILGPGVDSLAGASGLYARRDLGRPIATARSAGSAGWRYARRSRSCWT